VKLRVEFTDGSMEDEVIIRCGQADETIQRLQEYVLNMTATRLTFFKGTQEYYLPLEDILFFETEGEQVFAHTEKDAYKVKYKLYELEEILPRAFARAAKGTIVNTKRVFAINHNLTSSSRISFKDTHKHVYVSRHYYKSLKESLNERSI